MQMKPAFTLVELLVVITIIAVLLALLTPAMDRAVEHAVRAACSSNLHAIHLGVTAYAVGNRQVVIEGYGATTTPIQIAFAHDLLGATTMPAMSALASVGLAGSDLVTVEGGHLRRLPSKALDCPARPFKSGWRYSDEVFTIPPGTASGTYMGIGYQYFGGMRNWIRPASIGGNTKAASPIRLSRSLPDWALAADTTIKADTWGGSWSLYQGMPSHQPNQRPEGGNHIYVDGGAEWVAFDRMVWISWYNASETVRAFWYQRDLNGWDPPDDALAKNNP